MLEQEEQPDDLDLVGKAFRSMHTIKGSGSMFGFGALTDFTHHLENVLDKVRGGEHSITPALITVIQDSLDHIRNLLEHSKGNDELSEASKYLLAWQSARVTQFRLKNPSRIAQLRYQRRPLNRSP